MRFGHQGRLVVAVSVPYSVVEGSCSRRLSDGSVERIEVHSRKSVAVVTATLDRYRILVSIVVTYRYLAVRYPPPTERGHASPRPLFRLATPLALSLSSITVPSKWVCVCHGLPVTAGALSSAVVVRSCWPDAERDVPIYFCQLLFLRYC